MVLAIDSDEYLGMAGRTGSSSCDDVAADGAVDPSSLIRFSLIVLPSLLSSLLFSSMTP